MTRFSFSATTRNGASLSLIVAVDGAVLVDETPTNGTCVAPPPSPPSPPSLPSPPSPQNPPRDLNETSRRVLAVVDSGVHDGRVRDGGGGGVRDGRRDVMFE